MERSLPRSVWQSAVKLYESPLLVIGENAQPGVCLCFLRLAVGSTHSCRFIGGGFGPCFISKPHHRLVEATRMNVGDQQSSTALLRETLGGGVADAAARSGRYEFNTHSGTVRLTLGSSAGFELNASTFSGDIRSDLPVTINDVRSRRGPGRSVRVVVSDGAASLTVSTFSGDVIIRKQ